MHCPRCVDSSLSSRKIQRRDITVDVCLRCKGVWFDAEELNRLTPVASRDLRVPGDAKTSGRTCPRCRVPLGAFNYPQTYVEIDMCSECLGLWLERGELKEIQAVRKHWDKKGELETHAPVVGFKGTVLRWVNSAIEVLADYE